MLHRLFAFGCHSLSAAQDIYMICGNLVVEIARTSAMSNNVRTFRGQWCVCFVWGTSVNIIFIAYLYENLVQERGHQ